MIELQQKQKENAINRDNAIVAIYPTHTDAESAIKELQQSGFDMKKLSIVARDYHTEENVVGYYNTGGCKHGVRSEPFGAGCGAFCSVPRSL